jgi:hypothetical protein
MIHQNMPHGHHRDLIRLRRDKKTSPRKAGRSERESPSPRDLPRKENPLTKHSQLGMMTLADGLPRRMPCVGKEQLIQEISRPFQQKERMIRHCIVFISDATVNTVNIFISRIVLTYVIGLAVDRTRNFLVTTTVDELGR